MGTVDQAIGAAALLARLVWHARLDVLFDPDQTYRVAGNSKHPGKAVTYVHLVCVNASWFVTGTGCLLYLKRLWWGDSHGRFIEHPGFVGPVLMRWANTPDTGPLANQPMEMEPRGERRVDLGYTVHGEQEFRLYIPEDYTGVVRALEPGSYRLQVAVRATNSFPRRVNRWFSLEIAPDGSSQVQRLPGRSARKEGLGLARVQSGPRHRPDQSSNGAVQKLPPDR